MSEIKRKVEEICFYCNHFGTKTREPEDTEKGLMYCKLYKKHFPNQFGENATSAAGRTCLKWKD